MPFVIVEKAPPEMNNVYHVDEKTYRFIQLRDILFLQYARFACA